ncbi:chondroitinase-B domain-containing protein [Aliiglaciecola lipolytica]|uniref:Leucyl-tRNA synthetase class Ia n=1 Tax=Aliiglaciecola lipolytica E3 TaxID=1127673 RepID=K6YB32_9ALTE|nr:chondroitinase-B domain-containing protein [Aliiglaciecola lipolytica]GAC13838.1 leucyl-tRNA synthetase class Ia [Aliiglaciecola lipolytica E3]
MKKCILAIAIAAGLTGCGSSNDEEPTNNNTAATFSGDSSATVAANQMSVSGTLTITDPDEGEDAAVAQTDAPVTYGTFSISSEGQWQYSLDTSDSSVIALADGSTVTDVATVSSVDGTMQDITITITGINEAPVFGTGDGVDSATIVQSMDTPISGNLSIMDADANESAFISQNAVLSSFGEFSIDEDGAWTYTLDTSNSTVVGLNGETDTVVDELSISSVDGTQTRISITITGEEASSGSVLTKGSIGDNDSVPEINCTTTVNSTSDLEDAVSFAMTAGETICLASGNYTGLDLSFGGTGTADMPITVAAAVPGEVIIDGEVFIGMTGEYVVFQGFVFKDGTIDSSILQTRANSNTACNNCRITENSFINMDEGLDDSTKWFQIYGSNNRFDHNWVSGKSTQGALFIVERGDAPGTEDRTQIDHNYFGDRPPKDGLAYADQSDNEYEGIRIGSSNTHTSDSFAVIEHNYFEAIDAEAEVISIKAGSVTVAHNTIRNSRGSIVNRHGEGSNINNNFIIGDDNPFSGGIRIVDANHSVTNNYIQGARNPSSNFYGGILISASDGSTSNGYQDVENVLVANNTIVDSANSINLFAGNEDDRPDSVYFVNNVVADAIGPVVKNADNLPDNSIFTGNYVFGQSLADDDAIDSLTGMTFVDPELEADSSGVYRPTAQSATLTADLGADTGDYDLPTTDMDGQTRSAATLSGADEILSQELALTELRGLLSPELVGPLSYTPPTSTPYIAQVDIQNANFDTQSLDGWNNSGAQITTQLDEVFSRNSSVKLDSQTDSITQTVTVEANTNYTLSAFTNGVAKLSATVGGDIYSVDQSSSEYKFTSVSFNSAAGTSLEIKASLDDFVLGSVDITNPNFDDGQDGWVVNEGTGIGQVQDSSNSASGADGSIKFTHNDADSGTPYQPYIAQTVTVQPNTEYTLTMYILLKDNDEQDATVLFGAHTGSAIEGGVFDNADIVASKNSVYANLSEDLEGDDSFRPDVLVFNSGDNTTITIFAQYQSTLGDDIRIDDFSLTAEGAPSADAEAFFDSFRLVSHPSLN